MWPVFFICIFFFVGNGLWTLKILKIIHLTAERISDNMVYHARDCRKKGPLIFRITYHIQRATMFTTKLIAINACKIHIQNERARKIEKRCDAIRIKRQTQRKIGFWYAWRSDKNLSVCDDTRLKFEISLNFSWNGFTKIEVLGRVWNVKLEFPIHTYTCAFSNLTRRRRRWHSFFNLIRVHSAKKKRNFLPFTINNVWSNTTNWVNNTHIFFPFDRSFLCFETCSIPVSAIWQT